ncbi:hypothetical protein HGP16_07625 [Rhizobium sp. P40RR-XXII]|uniref:hypothetical protein n=1 Tax=unclassified Rhizobium TaxID=2613769 RepID=UPI00145744CD|nr:MULTISPECIES: hypothetical protein [unclassified Rhizobium]NLR84666.1 hypothetical protein [Rhizobium sp. P28RR-XV]NLS16427.1 hypothetical protein [Rhizobium sp. P40RR-XXII]
MTPVMPQGQLFITPIGVEILCCFTLPSTLAIPQILWATVTGGKSLEQFQEKCIAVLRPELRRKGNLAGIWQSLLMPSSRGVASNLAVERIMERLKRLAQGDLSQNELEVLKRVFDLVTRQSWFDDTQYSREGFAAALVGLFRCGMTNPTQLERIAMFWALSDFSQSMSNGQRAKLRSLYSRGEAERQVCY